MLPTTDFFGTQITRLILGDNPTHGNSYIPDIFSREEMEDYYTHENTVGMLFRAQEAGYNTALVLASPKMLAAFRDFYKQGGKLHIIFQTFPPMIDCFAENIAEMAEFNPLAIYHQGSTGENLLENRDYETYLKNCETIRKTGLPVGMAFHDPDNVLRAEKENWGADFYILCPYNSRRNRKGHQSSFITGETKAGLVFHPEDRHVMFKIIREINKPVVVIKAFAGGQIFTGLKKEDREAAAEKYIAETFENIKPSDTICVGVYQGDDDHIGINANIVRRVLCK